MASKKKAPKFSDLHDKVCQALQRVFYYEDSDEERSVRHFSDWAKEKGFDITDSKIYPFIAGTQNPSWDFVKAVLSYSDDPELHALLTPDKSVTTSAIATLRTAADGLKATADRLEGKKK